MSSLEILQRFALPVNDINRRQSIHFNAQMCRHLGHALRFDMMVEDESWEDKPLAMKVRLDEQGTPSYPVQSHKVPFALEVVEEFPLRLVVPLQHEEVVGHAL